MAGSAIYRKITMNRPCHRAYKLILVKDIPLQDTDERLVQLFRALGHPARLCIVRLLERRQTCICAEVVAELPLSQSTVSQHLKVLKDAGLIIGEVEGPAVCYCLAPAALTSLHEAVAELSKGAGRGTYSCDPTIEEVGGDP